MKVLMVCLGNICRSPLAEGILREKARRAGLDWEIDSAGTNGYHTGEAPHALSQKVARANGLDISTQRARRFTADDFQHFDKIYAMAGDVLIDIHRIAGKKFEPAKVDLLLNETHPGENRDVPDPWSGPERGYHEVYKMLETAADKIIAKYGQPANHTGEYGQPANHTADYGQQASHAANHGSTEGPSITSVKS